jgi:hypothetical protein
LRRPPQLKRQTALLAIETSEVSVEEVHALLGFTDQCDDMIEYSPDPDVRLIRNVWARKGALERVRRVKYMRGLFACNELLHTADVLACWTLPRAHVALTPQSSPGM